MYSFLQQAVSFIAIYVIILFTAFYFSENSKDSSWSSNERGSLDSNSLSTNDHPRRLSPLIGTKNISRSNIRFDFVHNQFEKAISSKHDWKVLRSADNITIETMESEDTDWPIYIKTTSIIEADPLSISRLFTWPLFQKTQEQIDPFHESIIHHAASGDTHIITKVRKFEQSMVTYIRVFSVVVFLRVFFILSRYFLIRPSFVC